MRGYPKELEILSIKMNRVQTLFAVVVGFNLFEDEKEVHLIYIYKITDNGSDYGWTLKKLFTLEQAFRFACIHVEFKNRRPDEIYLSTINEFILLNYETGEMTSIHEFEEPICAQPLHFVFNMSQ